MVDLNEARRLADALRTQVEFAGLDVPQAAANDPRYTA